jgi:sulfur-carrier protein
MAVTVKIPTQLRSVTGGAAEASAEGTTVAEVLDSLYREHSELRQRIAGDDGGLRRFVNIYLAGEDIRFLEGLDTPVPDGAELTILPAVAGG